MDVNKLRARMTESVRSRFDDTWRKTFYPDVSSILPSLGSPSRLVLGHAKQLEEYEIAARAAGPGPWASVPFTVLEEKDGSLRQRFILWTLDGNRAAEAAGYVASVPLAHVSHYLGAVHEECGTTRDFRTGFYAIEIPKAVRHLFRFTTDDGSWWELNRLPMGHACAPELMHTLAAVSAGHPDFVLPELVEGEVVVHVWVDNIRYAGSRQCVLAATRRLDQTAVDCSLTWKDADSRTAAPRYEFIGVDWRHSVSQVSLSSKLCRKLMTTRYELQASSLSAGDIEALGGRLLHASAIAGIFPGSFWFALKFMRRVTNSLNRGTRMPTEQVSLSPCIRSSLQGWIDAVMRPRAIPTKLPVPSLTVFVDASKKGWGGVLVDSRTAEITILGAPWSAEESRLHINVLEAMAFERSAMSIPDAFAGGRIDVVVDNTTVQGVARKGFSMRDADLNNAVVSGLARVRTLGCALSVRWVRSEGNPADLPSRVPLTSLTPKSIASVTQAVVAFFTGGGVEGR
ncbi:hypothetical protein DIPPA_28435 [Diplonema papillatum]|nr:hypothetical protein DIPPA_17802 [Diplonema papillatum]KAJ9442657.1 hypothetical protein DIPPA_23565 [Diplonema papillatum]KAJ9445334.1 hypothetical protein DIPPA_24010 [Diplonema papillatum]KAJ9451084.1 hypothetical protein DIPPA_16720 [Diplonema papillatum]KAJ9453138.1 hypothetical protein DIPPA_28022 [Diplonema papillatum]